MTDGTCKIEDSTAAASPNERLVMWHDTTNNPLCKRVSRLVHQILVDDFIEVIIPLSGAKGGPAENTSWTERYIARVSDTGELVDWSGNHLGMSWEDVKFWKILDAEPAT